MDDNETKTCTNCKRDIPSVNYTIHSLHCARNIRTCKVCKEPVPTAELQEHHNNFHRIVPCKQCGEGVCGTDLEDHIRDSCGLTLRECRHCSLELPRADIPPHEQYCGARTERCPDCHEIVMIKYQMLHLESNHSFLKLSDEPGPNPSWMVPNHNTPKLVLRPSNVDQPTWPERVNSDHDSAHLEQMFANLDLGPSENVVSLMASRNPGPSRHSEAVRFQAHSNPGSSGHPGPSGSRSEAVKKRTNDMPQLNSSQDSEDSKIVKEFVNYSPNLRGRPFRPSKEPDVKKRLAPKPPSVNPRPAPPPNPTRDRVLHNAMLRRQQEEKEKAEVMARHRALGIAPPLTTAQKLKHLRSLSALQNGESSNEHQQSQTRNTPDLLAEQGNLVKKSQNGPRAPQRQFKPISVQDFEERLAHREMNWRKENQNDTPNANASRDVQTKVSTPRNPNTKDTNATANVKVINTIASVSESNMNNDNAKKLAAGSSRMHVKNQNAKKSAACSSEVIAKNENIKNSNVRAAQGNGRSSSGEVLPACPDRFSSIKNELRQLRRGLNEVTAPYNSPGSSTAQTTSAHDEALQLPERSTSPNILAASSASDSSSWNLEMTSQRENSPAINQWDYINDDQYSDLCNVELPCEFCHEMISANELVLHESGCAMGNPNLVALPTMESPENAQAPLHSPAEPFHQPVDPPRLPAALSPQSGAPLRQPGHPHHHHQKPLEPSHPSQAPSEDQLPCEFCLELLDASQLMAHQDVCQFN